MSFYARWQPLRLEDDHTALVFGFLRHAPPTIALEPWLSRVLGREVTAEPLHPSAFWPLLPSVVECSTATEPELLFDVRDSCGPLKVVVEVKPGIGMQTVPQLSREIVDVATRTGARRIALIMVDAELGPAASAADRDQQVLARVAAACGEVDARIHRSSFALLAEVIAAAARQNREWERYADDVIWQLKDKGVLRYEGAPMLNDLEPLSLRDAVEAYNRIVAAARQFFLELHEAAGFTANELAADVRADARSPQILRDGRTDKLHQPPASFRSNVILSVYRHSKMTPRSRGFVAFDLTARDAPDIELLAGRWDYDKDELLPNANTFATALSREVRLADTPQTPFHAWAGVSRWTYDRRPWQSGNADEDIHWTVERLVAAIKADS